MKKEVERKKLLMIKQMKSEKRGGYEEEMRHRMFEKMNEGEVKRGKKNKIDDKKEEKDEGEKKKDEKEDENEEDRRKRLKFSCKECGERYASNRDLQGHTDRTHDDKWVQCSICPENPLIASISVKSAWLEEKQDLSFPKEPTRPPRSHRPVNLEGHKRRSHRLTDQHWAGFMKNPPSNCN